MYTNLILAAEIKLQMAMHIRHSRQAIFNHEGELVLFREDLQEDARYNMDTLKADREDLVILKSTKL